MEKSYAQRKVTHGEGLDCGTGINPERPLRTGVYSLADACMSLLFSEGFDVMVLHQFRTFDDLLR